ncbi:hypothetical protein B0T24DRAFT_641634 [Lasiosphaeria ovina]|uniref:Secreted protein n=1 Tax=Lasiosphaeria ovina TaxID=92902 RepID=A0AAE0MY71_9PEZI|nr:hypothetical protein B0T24DRAFT_641634 [Lasiosphaeria ovina]
MSGRVAFAPFCLGLCLVLCLVARQPSQSPTDATRRSRNAAAWGVESRLRNSMQLHWLSRISCSLSANSMQRTMWLVHCKSSASAARLQASTPSKLAAFQRAGSVCLVT